MKRRFNTQPELINYINAITTVDEATNQWASYHINYNPVYNFYDLTITGKWENIDEEPEYSTSNIMDLVTGGKK